MNEDMMSTFKRDTFKDVSCKEGVVIRKTQCKILNYVNVI